MCGICGRYSREGVDRAELLGMTRALAHRGPDDEGIFLGDRVGLGCRRLAIIDLETGGQPVTNEDGSIRTVFNGEIYNYRELRRDLEQKGHRFRTRSDTEVLVHLYEDEGERCVERLEGMFAFAIWDERHDRLLLARDPLGQKPLFYAREGDELLFASELKAILAVRRRPPELDPEALHHYLSLRFVPPPRTMFRGIAKLPAGHYLVFDRGASRVERYWSLDFRAKSQLSEEELLEELEERLSRAVVSHLVSDVPVGAMLSGGLDSSMIVALMARAGARPFETFSIGVAEQSFNELPYARMVAETCGTRHVEETVDLDLLSLLPEITRALDEPSDPIAACMYHAARLASRHVKVVLGGDGGDELFAGFDRYLGVAQLGRIGSLPRLLLRGLLAPALALVPEDPAYKSATQKLRWVHRLAAVPDLGRRYAAATEFFRFSHAQKSEILGGELWSEVGDLDSAAVLVRQFEGALADDPIDRMLYTDYMTRLPEHTLMLSDRTSMAHGLEIRSPWVDADLVRFLATFPPGLKIRGRRLKHLLRRLGERYLPRQITRRPKQGFMFPLAFWFRDELYPFAKGFLAESRVVSDGILQGAAVDRLVEEHRRRKVDHHARIWMLLNLEVWYRTLLLGHQPQELAAEIGERVRSSRREASEL
jgi:asparagine synthase (glutamine-hydrolysing)